MKVIPVTYREHYIFFRRFHYFKTNPSGHKTTNYELHTQFYPIRTMDFGRNHTNVSPQSNCCTFYVKYMVLDV